MIITYRDDCYCGEIPGTKIDDSKCTNSCPDGSVCGGKEQWVEGYSNGYYYYNSVWGTGL